MYKHILVPVLLDEDHDTAQAFAVARVLAAEGATFSVIHVMESLPTFATTQISEEVLAGARKAASDALGKLAKELEGAEVHMIHGHPGQSITAYAAEKDVDCIIIASHKPGLEDYFLGSTAARVVRHARCAVHVIR